MSDRTDQPPGIDPDVVRAVQDWTAEQERTLSGHPDSDALLAYQESRLDEAAQAELRAHLVICEACRDDLLALDAFDEDVPEDEPLLPSPHETARSWQRFEQARGQEDRTQEARGHEHGAEENGAKRGPRLGWQTWGLLLAAGVILALGASLYLRDGKQADNRGAVLGSPVVFGLEPDGASVMRGAEGQQQVVVTAGTSPLLPALKLGDLTAYGHYFAEVLSEGEKRLFRRDGLARDAEGRVTFLADRSEWPEGDWTIRLYGAEQAAPEASSPGETSVTLLATYTLQLRYEP